MKCPNCGNRLTEETYDRQEVLHCDRCGISFFEENGINRITLSSAQELATEISEPIVLGNEKFCPKDKAKLQPYHAESVPEHVTLLGCPLCFGILAFPDDLVEFKKAQDAKINFYKVWRQPLSSISSVLVVSLVLMVSISTLVGMTYFVGRSSVPTNASDVVKNVLVTTSGRYTLISFKTNGAFKSELFLEEIGAGKGTLLQVSTTPKEIHTLTTTEINPKHTYRYEIILTDQNGRSIVTEKKELILQK